MATVMNAGHSWRRVEMSRMCVLDSMRLLAITDYDDLGVDESREVGATRLHLVMGPLHRL